MRTRARTRVGAAVVAATLAAMIWTSPSAQADTFSGATRATGCFVNVTDNSYQTYYVNGMDAAMRDAVDWSRVNNTHNQTVVNAVKLSSWNSATDVVGFTSDFNGPSSCNGGQVWCCESGPGLAGAAWVESLDGDDQAAQHRLYFEWDAYGPGTTNYRRGLACHEVGHTLGLEHTGTGCLVDPADAVNRLFNNHQAWHVNDYENHGWTGPGT